MDQYGTTASILITSSALEGARQRLSRKLQKMTELPVGWSYGEGMPVSNQAVALAEWFVLLSSIYEVKADVFPNLDGGCAVAFYADTDRLEVSIHVDGSAFDLSTERGIGFEFEEVIPPTENANFEKVLAELSRLKLMQDKEWNLHESSIYDNLIGLANDSEMSSSSIPRSQQTFRILQIVAGGFQYLIPHAPVHV